MLLKDITSAATVNHSSGRRGDSGSEVYELPNKKPRDLDVDGADSKLRQVLILSSSLLTDRMLHRTRMLHVLSESFQPVIWATSARTPDFAAQWRSCAGTVEQFPSVQPFKEFPYNYLRRLNEFAWDYRLRPPSRLSMMRHVRNKTQPLLVKSLKAPARAIAMTRQQGLMETWLESFLMGFNRSPEAERRLTEQCPDLIVSTNPFWFTEPGVMSVAKRLGIPTLAMVPSWDNITTKPRMVFNYDGYIVWSEQARRELHSFYPQTKDVPIYVVGAPQFDVFFQPRYEETREAFCRRYGLRADLPIVVHAIGSPNFLKEHHGAIEMARRVSNGELGDVQLIVRPHPIHDNAELLQSFSGFGTRIVVQVTGHAGADVTRRFQSDDQVFEWVNTFRHADVVVNLSSTVSIDAAIFDTPVVNLDFDPEPGQPNQHLINDINHLWSHFKPVAESGGVWLTTNYDETVGAVRAYLADPSLHRGKRRWMAEYVCGYLDGRCGERVGQAIMDFSALMISGAKDQ
jgi:hypothetical protein